MTDRQTDRLTPPPPHTHTHTHAHSIETRFHNYRLEGFELQIPHTAKGASLSCVCVCARARVCVGDLFVSS